MPHALCVYLPRWSIQRMMRLLSAKSASPRGEPPEPFVLLLSFQERGKQLVAACCAPAERQHVRIGMTLAHARSLLQGCRVVIRDFAPDEDRRALHRLALWALRFTPIVAVDEPDGLLMDIAGCEHLYGGDRPMVQRITHALDRLGLDHRIVVGPTFSAVRAVARYTNERVILFDEETLLDRVAGLPVDVLRVESSVHEALNAVGVERIGQLLSLPREALAARHGNSLLRCLDQMMGAATELIRPVHEPDPFSLSYVFDGPVLDAAVIEATTRELLGSLTRALKKACLGVACLVLKWLRIDTTPETLTWTFAHSTCEPQHIWSLIRPRVERVSLGFGVEVIVLSAVRTAMIRKTQGALWPDWSDDHGAKDAALGELLDHLIDHLGPQAVTRLEVRESHAPENVFRHHPFGETGGHPSTGSSGVIDPSTRPSRLFDIPQPAQVITPAPDGPPAQIVWRGETLAVRHGLGPERILLPWWLTSPVEGRAVQEIRDYYAVQDGHGRWLWLFRRDNTGSWFVHGEWA